MKLKAPGSQIPAAQIIASLILGVGLMVLAGCASIPAAPDVGGPGDLPQQPIDAPPPPPPGETPAPEPGPPPPPPPPPAELLNGLAWENGHSERAIWSTELRTQIKANLTSFNKAPDLADICSAYGELSDDDKVNVLATMAVAIAKYESNYNPHTIYHEPPPLGVDSVGLYQLSYEDGFSWCVLDRANASLEDPINNIRCAIPKMAKLIAKDRILTAGSTGANAMGLARYWSVMRLGAGHHLEDIRAATRSLALCQPTN